MSLDKTKLESLKETVINLSANQAILLKEHISEVIKVFNYKDPKVHGHLNELLLTLNTDKGPDEENFNDIRKKLIYLIDIIITDHYNLKIQGQ